MKLFCGDLCKERKKNIEYKFVSRKVRELLYIL